MIQLIAPGWYGAFNDELQQMYRLRYRVFKKRLAWEVEAKSGLETDWFDDLKPYYLLLRGSSGSVNGCVRFLPSTGPTMLGEMFPYLVEQGDVPTAPDIWESSRFALDLPSSEMKTVGGIAIGTYELFAGMIEFGLSLQLNRIVTVTDVRVERILRRCGWSLSRLGEPRMIGTTQALAGFLEVSSASLETVRSNGGLASPVLWAPVAAGRVDCPPGSLDSTI